MERTAAPNILLFLGKNKFVKKQIKFGHWYWNI